MKEEYMTVSRKGAVSLGLIAIILAGLFMASQMEGLFATVDYSQISSYRFGEPEFMTISCKRSGNPVSDMVTITSSGAGHTVNKADVRIDSISLPSGTFYVEVKTSYGSRVCKTNEGTGCNNIPLAKGQTYSFTRTCGFLGCSGDPVARIIGQPVFLKVSVPQIGIDNVDFPGSAGCIVNDLTAEAAKVTTTQLGALADNIDMTVPRTITLELDQAKEFPRGIYREIPNIFSINYNSQAGVCNQVDKKIYGFTAANALDGTKWALLDKGNILLDGRQGYFACSSDACQTLYGLDSSFKVVNYFCIKAEQPRQQCLIQSDCGQTQFIESADGTTTLREFSCVQNQCKTADTKVACSPLRQYPNSQCCKRDVFGSYRLEACMQPLLSCESLGSDACCLGTQSTYTYKPAPEGKYCCDRNSDGIGKVTQTKAACDQEDGDGGCGLDIGCWLKSLLDALGNIGQWIIVVLLIILGVVVLPKVLDRR